FQGYSKIEGYQNTESTSIVPFFFEDLLECMQSRFQGGLVVRLNHKVCQRMLFDVVPSLHRRPSYIRRDHFQVEFQFFLLVMELSYVQQADALQNESFLTPFEHYLNQYRLILIKLAEYQHDLST